MVKNIGTNGADSFFFPPNKSVPPVAKSLPPAPVNPATTGGATEVPSGAITVPSTTSDQFVSIGNRAVVNSGLVTSTQNEKNDDINPWNAFAAVAVEPETDANAVLPALNMKPGVIKLTESSPQETKLVIAKFMENPDSMGSIIIGGLNL